MNLRRKWYALLAAAPMILALSLLPSALYVDHWIEYAGRALGPTGAEPGAAERVSHASHCHFGPGACSDQPVAPAAQVVPAVVELTEPDFPTVALDHRQTSLEETILSVPTEPPRV